MNSFTRCVFLRKEKTVVADAKGRSLMVAAILGSLLLSLLYLSAIGPYWNITPDSATYVLAGKSLAAGAGYKEMGNPVYPHPPVTSLLLSIFILLFPHNYLPLNAVITIFALLSLSFSFILFKQAVGDIKSTLIVLLSLGSILLFRESTMILSDIFYTFFSILALVLMNRTNEKEGGLLRCVGVGIMLLVACFTRLIGVTLLLAIGIYSLLPILRRRKSANWGFAVMMFVVLVCVLLWEYRNSLLGYAHIELIFQNEAWVDQSGYISPTALLKRFYVNLGDYTSIGRILTNEIFEHSSMIHPTVKLFVHLFFPFAVCLGLFTSLKKIPTITDTYVIIYLLTLGLRTPPIKIRYFVPILPFLFYYTFLALEYVIQHARNFIRPIVPKMIHAGLVMYIAAYLGNGITYMVRVIPEEHKSPFGSYPIKRLYYYDTQRLAMWLKDNSRQGESYVCLHPVMWSVITERKGYSFPFSHDANQLLDLLKNEKVRYVLVDKKKAKVHEFLLPIINAYPKHFDLIKDEREASLYEFKLEESVDHN